MDRHLVRALRARGVDVQTAAEAGMIRQPDVAHLAHAARENRAVYTFNVGDFCRWHAEYVATARAHAGIVVSRQQHYSVGGQMRRPLRLIASRTADEMRNKLEFLSHWD